MPRFDDYLMEVQQRNGLNPIPLIRAWTQPEIGRCGIRVAHSGCGKQFHKFSNSKLCGH